MRCRNRRRLIARLAQERAQQHAAALVGVDHVVADQVAWAVQADAGAVVVNAIALDQLPRTVPNRNAEALVVMQVVVADDPVGHLGGHAVLDNVRIVAHIEVAALGLVGKSC